jgi:hypothetical protein
MNPRHRRLLIPGLLVALLVVVVIASLAHRADAAIDPDADRVSTISDSRVVEASGLAVSVRHDDLAYVVNDSDQAQEVYAVRISTGEVVGATAVTGGTWRDTEALSIDTDGTLWVADTGDNLVAREDAALYAFDEPGVGDHTVAATRYPVTYEGGAVDVEALLVDPASGAKLLVSKGFVGGQVFVLPDDLTASEPNTAERVAAAPAIVTDGAVTPDGRVLLRTYLDVQEVDRDDFSVIRSIATPPVEQGETLAVEPGGRTFLVGSEGASSPLYRVAIPTGAVQPTASPTPTEAPVPIDANGDPRANQGFAGRAWFGAAFGLAALLGVSVWAARGR